MNSYYVHGVHATFKADWEIKGTGRTGKLREVTEACATQATWPGQAAKPITGKTYCE